MDELIYKIALTLIPGVGNVNGKNLVAYCGGVKAVFCERKRALLKIPGIGEQTVKAIVNNKVLDRAALEEAFILKYGIQPLFYLDEKYPARLKHCSDGPMLLYFKGNADLENPKVLSLVGTRNGTEYGREQCRRIIDGLKPFSVLIISGLAYGIDTWSHKAALDAGMDTVAVLGHGLDRIYPFANRNLAEKMCIQGGLLTEFTSGTKPDRENFPMRNRIIAGMSDAIIVVEAGEKGGALITADIGNSYNRDVFAVPGRVGDSRSIGCNYLIRTNRAALITSAEDVCYFLNWNRSDLRKNEIQGKLFEVRSRDEELILGVLRESGILEIDTILDKTGLTSSKAAAALLQLEVLNLVKCMPGKLYQLL
jgi:DNA processing protein